MVLSVFTYLLILLSITVAITKDISYSSEEI